MEKNNSNFLWADLIRIFAIFGVICIHTIDPNSSWFNNFIVKVSQTSVPLFVMLSGSLLLGKLESYKVFFNKRITKVLIPWISWNLIYMLYFYFISKDSYVLTTYFSNSNFILGWIKFFIIQFMTGLWFLPLIFSLYLITPALRIFLKYARNIDILFILFMWLIVIVVIPSFFRSSIFPIWESNLIYTTIQYLGFYILGLYLFKNIKKKQIDAIPWFIFVFLIPIITLMPISSFINIYTLTGSIIIYIYFRKISDKYSERVNFKLKTLISKISESVLGIYLIHQLIIFEFNKLNLNIKINIDLIFTFLVFFVSVAVILFIKKFKYIKLFLT